MRKNGSFFVHSEWARGVGVSGRVVGRLVVSGLREQRFDGEVVVGEGSQEGLVHATRWVSGWVVVDWLASVVTWQCPRVCVVAGSSGRRR